MMVFLPNEVSLNQLSRIAAAHRIEQMDADMKIQATALAVDYQLISRYTNYLIIADRETDMQPAGLPMLAHVPQMYAAGYGCLGSVIRCRRGASATFDGDSPPFPLKQNVGGFLELIKHAFFSQTMTPVKAVVTVIKATNWYHAFLRNIRNGLPKELIAVLDGLVKDEGWPDQTVAAALLIAMLNQLDNVIPRHDKRKLLVALKAESPPQLLIDYFTAGLKLIGEEWEWCSVYELLPMVP